MALEQVKTGPRRHISSRNQVVRFIGAPISATKREQTSALSALCAGFYVFCLEKFTLSVLFVDLLQK